MKKEESVSGESVDSKVNNRWSWGKDGKRRKPAVYKVKRHKDYNDFIVYCGLRLFVRSGWSLMQTTSWDDVNCTRCLDKRQAELRRLGRKRRKPR